MSFWKSLFGKKDEDKTVQPAQDAQQPSQPAMNATPNNKAAHANLLELVKINPEFSLPRFFVPHLQDVEKIRKEFISIESDPVETMSFTQSKFGHYPCIPKNFAYPKDSEGNLLFPLAQINFSEMPPLAGFPGSGFLQFYIGVEGIHGDVYGLNFDNPQLQDSFRVLFFEEEEVKEYQTDFGFLSEVMESNNSPLPGPFTLSADKEVEYISVGDHHFAKNAPADFEELAAEHPEIEDELMESLYDNHSSTGHRIGGYAFFTQTDPRSYKPEIEDYVLLFQMDSIEDIMWGDAGVANFFIHPDDLARKDFSKVFYNWDCH